GDLHNEEVGYLCLSRELAYRMRYLGAPDKARTGVVDTPAGDAQISEKMPAMKAVEPNFEGILFVPNVGSDYCLGTCKKIASQLRADEPNFPIKFIASYSEIDDPEERFESVNWTTLMNPLFGLRYKSVAKSLAFSKRYLKRLAANPDLSSAAREAFGRFWRLKIGGVAFKHSIKIEIAGKWLEKNPASVVVTMNDVVRPGACFITAAKKLGISTIVIQHGVYGPLNVPFEADECWVWGSLTRKFMQSRGAHSSRLHESGNFEIEYDNPVDIGSTNPTKEILLLLQWGGIEIWGDPIFGSIVGATASAMMEINPEWKLRLRAHPSDGEDAKKQVVRILEEIGIEYSFSQPGCSILEDVYSSAAVLAVNSSALAHAIALGIPCLQYLPERLEKRLGTRFVGEENVARCPQHLVDWFGALHTDTLNTRENPSLLFSNFGKALQSASERILMLGT
ncbi:hypothetical protein OAE11_01365, partial [Akkermansiaceae bacterium]|nr:hypothetical protein [Akkermansiaceae bacterium]